MCQDFKLQTNLCTNLIVIKLEPAQSKKGGDLNFAKLVVVCLIKGLLFYDVISKT